VKLAPSILAADFTHLGDEIAEAERTGADRVHIDETGAQIGMHTFGSSAPLKDR
jgi:pentose-5-phosphate-3-epimerase